MHDSSRAAENSAALAVRSPRQLIEAVIELLRQDGVAATTIEDLLGNLAEALEQHFASQSTDDIHDDAVQRAPWLTADAERLKHQQTAVQQSFQAFQMTARRGMASRESLADEFDEFAELYLDYETAEQGFLEAAFPGPAWAEQI